jgi:hypothetical protein
MHSIVSSRKTRIVILDRKSRKQQGFETLTEVNHTSCIAFNALLSLANPVRFHYDKNLATVTITLDGVEDWAEVRTVVPQILAEHRVKAVIKYTWLEKMAIIWRAISSGFAIAWCFAAPKIKSFSFWVAPKIKSFALWLAPKIKKLGVLIAARLKSPANRQ